MHFSSTPRRPGHRSHRTNRIIRLVFLGFLLISALLLLLSYWNSQGDTTPPITGSSEASASVAFFDVGQGLSVGMVTGDGASLLYDFGLSRASMEETIIPWFENQGVETIDYAVLSHPHQDHLGGLPALLDGMPVNTFIDPVIESTNQTYAHSLRMLADSDIRTERGQQGSTYMLGEWVSMDMLWPGDERIMNSDGTENPNENSLVVRVDIGGIVVLLTGDIEYDTEFTLAEQYDENLRSDILQAGHHGSRTSSHDVFLNAVQPDVAVISAGFENQYGHPHEEALYRLRAANSLIYRTDLDGTVEIQITDGEYTVSAETEAQT